MSNDRQHRQPGTQTRSAPATSAGRLSPTHLTNSPPYEVLKLRVQAALEVQSRKGTRAAEAQEKASSSVAKQMMEAGKRRRRRHGSAGVLRRRLSEVVYAALRTDLILAIETTAA